MQGISPAVFQSTLPVWRATRTGGWMPPGRAISIHAPRVGSDKIVPVSHAAPAISIHAPRVGSDHGLRQQVVRGDDFNPRSPCGERRVAAVIHGNDSHFNPRSPCGERPLSVSTIPSRAIFQSTLPVWGATPVHSPTVSGRTFQSTLPVWGATLQRRDDHGRRSDFNPRSPCGERLSACHLTSYLR